MSDGQSEVTTERRIAFGGLEPGTTYLATVAQANEEGNAVSEEASISVVTRKCTKVDQLHSIAPTILGKVTGALCHVLGLNLFRSHFLFCMNNNF